MTDELQKFLEILPREIKRVLEQHPQRDNLIEVVMDLGRRPEARFLGQSEYLAETPITRQHLNYSIERVGRFNEDNRAGIEQTLHRISAIRNRFGEIIGLTCRHGRAVYGTIDPLRDLVERGQSMLLLGRPGVGKTTALREIARVLADDLHKRVVIVDTSNEIAGDGNIPHPAIGRARRMQVARPQLQHQVMIEAVENHMPEVIVIDEIGTEREAKAARTIAERGVQLVGTAHGNSIENLIKNPTLSDLVGGIQSVTLGDEEAGRRQTQKSILERKAPPTFEIAVEMRSRQYWVVHENVADTVDNLLLGHQPLQQVRTVDEGGHVTIRREPQRSAVKRRTGKLLPFPHGPDRNRSLEAGQEQRSLSLLPNQPKHFDAVSRQREPNRGEFPLRVYPYGVSHQKLAEAIKRQDLPVVLTRNLETAQVILTQGGHRKKDSKLEHLARCHQLPIHIVEASTVSAITRTLRWLLGMEQMSPIDQREKHFSSEASSSDEMEALSEARLAVERVVIPLRQPVDLLPCSGRIRKMQHQLVNRYRLHSNSVDSEPERHLRIYPA